MAKKAFKEETYELMDGTEIVARPLPIKPLRKVMERWEDISKLKVDDSSVKLMDIMFDCAVIAIVALNEHVDEATLEDSLDMDTVSKVLEMTSGIMLDGAEDPKVTAKA